MQNSKESISLELSSPITIDIKNKGTEPKKVTLFNAYKTMPSKNFGQDDDIEILSAFSSVSYLEMLKNTRSKPVMIGKTIIESTNLKSSKISILSFGKTIGGMVISNYYDSKGYANREDAVYADFMHNIGPLSGIILENILPGVTRAKFYPLPANIYQNKDITGDTPKLTFLIDIENNTDDILPARLFCPIRSYMQTNYGQDKGIFIRSGIYDISYDEMLGYASDNSFSIDKIRIACDNKEQLEKLRIQPFQVIEGEYQEKEKQLDFIIGENNRGESATFNKIDMYSGLLIKEVMPKTKISLRLYI